MGLIAIRPICQTKGLIVIRPTCLSAPQFPLQLPPRHSRNSSNSNTAMAAAAADDDVKLESFLQWLQVAPSPFPISRPTLALP